MALIRIGAWSLMSAMGEGFELCGETNDAPTARRLFERYRPSLVIVGPTLHGGDGIQLIKDFRKMDPNIAVLMLSASEEAHSIRSALHAGALGYLRIFDAETELSVAIERIRLGKRYVSKELQERVLDTFASGGGSGIRPAIDRLSDREREVFRCIGKGLGSSEIAIEMGVSIKTIETHKKRIKDKLSLASGMQLATRWANKCDWKQMVKLHAGGPLNAVRKII